MELLVSLVVTPLLIAGACLGARLWGPSVGGWLLAFSRHDGSARLPGGPDKGPCRRGHAAEGALAGNVSIAGFCLAYSWAAASGGWWLPCLDCGAAGFLAASAPMIALVGRPAAVLFAVVVALLWVAWHAMPSGVCSYLRPPRGSRWTYRYG